MQRLKSRPESVGAGFCSGPKKLGDPASEVNRKVRGGGGGGLWETTGKWGNKLSKLKSKRKSFGF